MKSSLLVSLSFACAFAPALAMPSGAEDVAGKNVYDLHCAACHGSSGDGNGPASVWLFPKPRNFSAGQFKIKSTPGTSLPTDDDLLQTVTRGMPGSSMPSFTYLSEQERGDAVQYVKHLTATIDASGKRVNKFEEAARQGLLAKSVEVPPEPVDVVESLTRGKDLFKKVGCFTCHGETGAGDGILAPTLRDISGIPTPPRDFNTGAFRGGATGRDLYLRIHNGLAGTQMPGYGEGAMTADDRWALVNYVLSLRRTDVAVNDMLMNVDGIIRAHNVETVPMDPMDSAWEAFEPARVPLNPLWPEPHPISAVAVTAVYDAKRIAFLCVWKDASFDGSAVRVQDFQDGMAMQFSIKGTTPFLGMGDAENPVNLWMWRASWQQEIEGERPDMHDVYPSMHVDVYLDTNDLYVTAAAAGNVIAAQHASAVEDANARGFGTLASQPMPQQNVKGRGVWHDGFWNVVFWRDLKPGGADDVNLAAGRPTPIAFAVWNGEQRDRNGRKVISNWSQLVLDK